MFTLATGESGKAFGSVTAQDIVTRLQNEIGTEIYRHKAVLEHPIKTMGEHEVTGPMAHTGEGSGIATIEGDTVIFRPEGAEEECQLPLKFIGSKLVVTQTGICGFGHNVSAEGTYKKVSSKKPKFGSD